MKNKELKDLFIKETNDIDIPLSNKILSVPLQEKTENALSEKTENNLEYSLFKIILSTICSCVLVFVLAIGAFLGISNSNKSKASNLTSYIIEINPAVCITADSDNKVISICSLNNGGDVLLSDEYFSNIPNGEVSLNDCVDKVISLTFENDYFMANENIRLFAINNREEFARKKGEDVQVHIREHLHNHHQIENVNIEFKYMNVEKFSGRMNFEGEHRSLDDYQEEIQNRQRYFDPNYLALNLE